MWLLVIGVFRLVVLLRRVGLIGLVGHGLLGTPIIPAANVDRSTPLTSSSVIRGSSPQSLRVWAFSGALAYRCGLGLSSHLGCAGDVGSWRMDGMVLGRAHGAANLVGGLWPLLHIRSFEMVLGPKTDRWLVKTVAGLLIVNGITQLTTSSTAIGRRLGVGTAAVLAAIDLVYVPARRISKMYLVDAAIEVGWIMAWCRVDKPAQGGSNRYK